MAAQARVAAVAMDPQLSGKANRKKFEGGDCVRAGYADHRGS